MTPRFTLALDGTQHAYCQERLPGHRVKTWYLNLRCGKHFAVETDDSEFSLGRALSQVQGEAARLEHMRLACYVGDKLQYFSGVPEVLRTLYNGEYGKECRRKEHANRRAA